MNYYTEDDLPNLIKMREMLARFKSEYPAIAEWHHEVKKELYRRMYTPSSAQSFEQDYR